MLEKQRMRSTYEQMAIFWILNTDGWKKITANHFNSEGHSLENLFISEIKQIHREEENYRKVKKSYWIQTL